MPDFALNRIPLNIAYAVELVGQDPSAAYGAWAGELGVSSTETLQEFESIEIGGAFWEFDLASAFLYGGSTKVLFFSSACIGFYRDDPGPLQGQRYYLADGARVSGLSPAPPLLLTFNHPGEYLRVYGAKLQRSGSSTIIFASYVDRRDSQSYMYDVAIRLDGSSLTFVGSAAFNRGPYSTGGNQGATVRWHEMILDGAGGGYYAHGEPLIIDQEAGTTIRLTATANEVTTNGVVRGFVEAPSLLSVADVAAVAEVGRPAGVEDALAYPQSLSPVRFGTPRIRPGTDVPARPNSLTPTRFGVPMVLIGMPPSSALLQARSLAAGQFGVASLASALQTGPVPSIQSTRFGPPALCVALLASSLSAPQFGAPSTAASFRASSFQPARLGAARSIHGLTATSVCSARWGTPRLRLADVTLTAQSLRPVQFGAPALGSTALRARALCATRFGRPALDRGALC